MAQEIGLAKCNFLNFRSSVTLTLTLTLTLDRVEVTGLRISGRGIPTQQITSKSEKTFSGRTDGRTDGRALLPIVGLLGHRPGDDLKITPLFVG